MHPVEPGFVIAEGLDDRLGEVDATTAVHVQRPGQVWVAPGAELMQIHDYVSEVVIPTLRTGGVASRTFRAKCAWATPEIPTSSESKLAGIFPRTYGADEKRWRLHGK
jgi:hypothetical protein